MPTPISVTHLPDSASRSLSRAVRLFRLPVLGLLVTLLSGACSKHTGLDESVRNLAFSTLEGEQIVLSQVGGPILVNFWSTSCAICLREMPDMVDLYQDYRGSEFELLAVAMPYDAPNQVLELAEARQWPFPIALDIRGEALEAFSSVKGTPTSYLIDADGRLVKRYVGAIPFERLREQLDTLLGVS
ncbi:MAG: TlpA family protein disulfide reductase [Granulosicoccus sp.]|nr:TlpA family protein disulfide reductase [Granulosicoccus sp.]